MDDSFIFMHGVNGTTDVEIIKNIMKMSEFWPLSVLNRGCEFECYLNPVRTNVNKAFSSGSQTVC